MSETDVRTPSAVMLIGIPASGKSTFYKQRLFDSHLRINPDQLRSHHREHALLEACLATQVSFVVDNTNATRIVRSRIVDLARSAGFRVIGYYFRSKLTEALQRNHLRDRHARMPVKGVLGISGQLERPSPAEGFDELWYVRMDGQGGFVVDQWGKNP